jgi:recombination protein RecA
MAQTALQQLLATRHVRRASGLRPAAAAAPWSLGELSGRVVELSGGADSAVLTVATGLVLQAQRAREPVAWIARAATFFPPDLAESGVDLEALVVVRAPASSGSGGGGAPPAPRWLAQQLGAAERLLRSGAFGLVVLDLGPIAELSLSSQTRLASLAQKHDCALLCLTEEQPQRRTRRGSLGSLVSLHATARRRLPAAGAAAGRFTCEVSVLKDKRRGPGQVHTEVCRGPTGLR